MTSVCSQSSMHFTTSSNLIMYTLKLQFFLFLFSSAWIPVYPILRKCVVSCLAISRHSGDTRATDMEIFPRIKKAVMSPRHPDLCLRYAPSDRHLEELRCWVCERGRGFRCLFSLSRRGRGAASPLARPPARLRPRVEQSWDRVVFLRGACWSLAKMHSSARL